MRGKERRVDAQREAAEQALIRAHVNAVLLDEGHRLMQGGGRYTTDEQLEWLKSLTNRTNVLHVLAGPYELFSFRNIRGQLARRGRDLHFARYHVERAEERKEFVAAVKYLLERVPLDVDLNALLRRWFAEGSVGCIGNLKTWLVDAVAATLAQGGTRLTEAMLTRTMPHPAKRVSLELDAREGEHQVETTTSDSVKQLQVRLRKSGKAGNGKAPSPVGKMPGPPHNAQTGLAAAPVPTSKPLPLPQVAPKPTKARVGQRGLGRDPVGETSALPLRTATGCTFSGKINLLPHQMEVAAVFHVECPECLAMREIHPIGDSVMFSWHVKRVTNTPNHGKRWVRRGSIWELAD